MVRAAALGERAPADTLRMAAAVGDSLEFAQITGVHVVGTRLLVSDGLMSYHLALVDPGGFVLSHFGRRGEGPGEFQAPTAVTPAGRAGVWVYDFGMRRFTRFDLSDPRRPAVRESWQPQMADVLLEPVVRGDGFVSNVLSEDHALVSAARDGGEERTLAADLPFDARAMPNAAGRRLMNRSFLAADPANERLALLFQFTSRLDLFSPDGAHRVTAYGPRETRTAARVENDRFFWEPENVMAYAGVAATSRYVYALFCGCAMREERLPDRVHVFAWNGEFVGEYALDRPVTALAVPEGDSILFAGTSEPYPQVGRWPLPVRLRR